MYSKDQLVILDVDGTIVDAFAAIERTFARHHMDIGDLERFQKRRNLFKYLGGLKEFPNNLKRQLGKQKRAKLLDTLTEVYREEALLYEGMGNFLNGLLGQSGLRTGLITRNITREPKTTLKRLFQRHGVALEEMDFFLHIPPSQEKLVQFRKIREAYRINPARCYACGDESKDYIAAQATGMHPFMVSYGFEDFERLTSKIGVPAELISSTPAELQARVSNSLDLDEGDDRCDFKLLNLDYHPYAHSDIDRRLATSG